MKPFAILSILLISLSFGCRSFNTETWTPEVLGQGPNGSADRNLLETDSAVTLEALASGRLPVNLSGAIDLEHPNAAHLQDHPMEVPVFAYLIHHSDFGYILIDTGTDSSYLENPFGIMQGWMVESKMSPCYVEEDETIEALLEPLGGPSVLQAIFFTHLHMDHSSGMPALPHEIPLIAGEGEWSPQIPLLFQTNHFQRGDLLYTLDFNSDYAVETGLGPAIDLLGDGSIWAVSSPGHSKGHVSYLVNSLDGPVLLAGDASILNLSLELAVGPGEFSTDKETAQEVLERFLAFQQEHPELRIWSGHDYPNL